MEYGSLTVDDLVDELLGLVNAVGNLSRVNGLAVETCGLNALVGSDDDTVAVRDLLGGQNVLGAAGAIGFNLDGNAHLFACLGKSLGSHVGVSDTCRAGCYSQYAVA